MPAIDSEDANSIGSKGLIYIGEQLLVYRRDFNTSLQPGTLDLPGGGYEPGETPFETLQREVQEEFGLRIERQAVSYVRTYPSSRQPDRQSYFFAVQLPASAESEISFGNEGSEYMVLSVAAYLARTDAWPEMQNRTRDYLAAAS